METAIVIAFQIFLSVLALFVPIGMFLFVLWKIKEKASAQGDLEVLIRNRDRHSVRTLIDLRGYLLSKKDKEVAENFLKN
jgi:hypothetical protein